MKLSKKFVCKSIERIKRDLHVVLMSGRKIVYKNVIVVSMSSLKSQPGISVETVKVDWEKK